MHCFLLRRHFKILNKVLFVALFYLGTVKNVRGGLFHFQMRKRTFCTKIKTSIAWFHWYYGSLEFFSNFWQYCCSGESQWEIRTAYNSLLSQPKNDRFWRNRSSGCFYSARTYPQCGVSEKEAAVLKRSVSQTHFEQFNKISNTSFASGNICGPCKRTQKTIRLVSIETYVFLEQLQLIHGKMRTLRRTNVIQVFCWQHSS